MLHFDSVSTFNLEIVTMPPTTAEGLAYDWISKKLYWSDASISSIVGMYTNGTEKKILANVASPRAVAVNPCKGFVYNCGV